MQQVLESWDAAEDSEEERRKAEKVKAAAASAAASKKSKSQRLAEHQAASVVRKAAEEAERLASESESPEARRLRLQQEEVENDMKHAVDLFAGAAVEDHGSVPGAEVKRKALSVVDPTDTSKSIDLSTIPLFNPTTKKQFQDLQDALAILLVAHVKKPHYSLFAQQLTRSLIKEMSSEQIRKVATACTTSLNEKLREEKAADKSARKTKAQKTKTVLVGAGGKDSEKIDTKTYEEFAE